MIVTSRIFLENNSSEDFGNFQGKCVYGEFVFSNTAVIQSAAFPQIESPTNAFYAFD